MKENLSFERMYGWAWCLRLAAELHAWDDPQGRQWRDNIWPLESKLVELTMAYLPKLSFPVRTGVHPDTAFALAQTLDYAQTVGNTALAELVRRRSRDYYLDDAKYNAAFEPSGEDFFPRAQRGRPDGACSSRMNSHRGSTASCPAWVTARRSGCDRWSR